MDTKHNDDILKTKREPLKERDGQPPSTPQPKKQRCYNCIYKEHCFIYHGFYSDIIHKKQNPATMCKKYKSQ